MDVGARIKAWRQFKGWTQEELAERVERDDGSTLTAGAISQFEHEGEHHTTPRQSTLEDIVAAFGITMERFYGRVPKKKAA